MSVAFDPYHKWLGIPPSQQPPTHYRLLGLEPFEADRDVIDAAANQRMVYLQDLAGGEHGSHSQTLLNHVSAARRCLLNPKSKADYDAKLRAEQAPLPVVVTLPAVAAAPAVDEHSSMFADLGLDESTGTEGAKKRTSARLDRVKSLSKAADASDSPSPGSRKRLWMLGAAGMALFVGLVTAFMIGGKSEEPKVAVNAAELQAQQAAQAALKNETLRKEFEARKAANDKKKLEDEKRAEEEKRKSEVAKTQAAQVAKKLEDDKKALAAKPQPMPAFHFAPKDKVLTEICDLVHFKNKYHLYFVAYPVGKPREISWGLAISDDLFHWTEFPIEFQPKGSSVPGSVFLDKSKSNDPTLRALLRTDTGGKSDLELKLASSVDGKKWTVEKDAIKLPDLKEIPPRHRVIYHPETKRWLLALARPAKDLKSTDPAAKVAHLLSYSSPDLLEWTPHPAVPLFDANNFADLISIPHTKLDKSKPLKHFIVLENSVGREFLFDGETITFPKNEPSQFLLGVNSSSTRVFTLGDGQRRGVVGIVKPANQNALSHTQLTLAMELALVENSQKKSYLNRRALPEFAKLPVGQPVVQNEEVPLLAVRNDPVPKEALPLVDSGAYHLELDLSKVDDQAKVTIEIRGTKFDITAKDFKSGTFQASNGFPMDMTNPLRVKIVSDVRSLDVSLGHSWLLSLIPAEQTGKPGPKLSITGSNAILKAFKLTPFNITPPKAVVAPSTVAAPLPQPVKK